MKKILVTGANGLLGRNICNNLVKENWEVHAVVKSEPPIKLDSINYVYADLSKDIAFDNFPINISCVLHLAQSNRYKDFPDGATDVFKVNVSSTHQLLEYARKNNVSHFIYASSGGVYSPSIDTLNEKSPILEQCKLGLYLGSKISGEILVQTYSAILQTSIIRPFFIYGSGQKRNMLLPRLYDNISNNTPIVLDNENGISINPIHVDDAAKSVIALLNETNSSIYNLAGPENLSLRQISEYIGEFTGQDPIFQNSGGGTSDIIADISLMKQNLHSPIFSLSEYIHDLV